MHLIVWGFSQRTFWCQKTHECQVCMHSFWRAYPTFLFGIFRAVIWADSGSCKQKSISSVLKIIFSLWCERFAGWNSLWSQNFLNSFRLADFLVWVWKVLWNMLMIVYVKAQCDLLSVCFWPLVMMSRSDDHWANEPEAAARPLEGAILPTSLHAGAGAHRRPAAPRVVGTSPHVDSLWSFKNGLMQIFHMELWCHKSGRFNELQGELAETLLPQQIKNRLCGLQSEAQTSQLEQGGKH